MRFPIRRSNTRADIRQRSSDLPPSGKRRLRGFRATIRRSVADETWVAGLRHYAFCASQCRDHVSHEFSEAGFVVERELRELLKALDLHGRGKMDDLLPLVRFVRGVRDDVRDEVGHLHEQALADFSDVDVREVGGALDAGTFDDVENLRIIRDCFVNGVDVILREEGNAVAE